MKQTRRERLEKIIDNWGFFRLLWEYVLLRRKILNKKVDSHYVGKQEQ